MEHVKIPTTYPDELIMAVKLRYQGFIDANYATL